MQFRNALDCGRIIRYNECGIITEAVRKMKTVSLLEIAGMENFSVSSLFVMNQNWQEGRVFEMNVPRRQNAFLYFAGAQGEYTTKDGRVLRADKGSIAAVPEGSEYALRFTACTGTPSTILVEFRLKDDEQIRLFDEIRIIESHLTDIRIADLLRKMASDYSMPAKPWLELKSGFYRLLSLLASHEERCYIGKEGFGSIEKGIRYLQNDVQQKLSLDEVAAMCFVSPAYFRRMFRRFAGISPQEYRNRRRVERAAELLLYSELSVAEIAVMLGFDSPSYFCRAFKKETGVTPSGYRRKAPVSKSEDSVSSCALTEMENSGMILS